MNDIAELFPGVDLGQGPQNGGCASPIGRKARRRPQPARHPHRAASPTLRGLASLQLQVTAGFDALIEALSRLENAVDRLRREQVEVPAQLMRRMAELERAMGKNQLHVPAHHSRRRPLGP
jgi:hypothetical protein